MKRIRIGNDINVVWSLMRDDAPFLLNAEKISLYLMTPYGRVELTDYSVEGNSVTWLFQGRHQKAIGKYTLVLVVNKGEEGMITTDACDFVNLVSCSCQLEGGKDEDGVETQTIVLESRVDVSSGESVTIVVDSVLSETSVNPVENRVITAELKKKADKTEIPTKLSQLEQDIEIGGGTTLTQITYADLVALRDNGKLVAGSFYRITDYITTTTQENTRSAGHPFDVIVLALSENTLAEEAYAIQREFNIDDYKDAYSGSLDAQMVYLGTYEHEGKVYHLYDADNHTLQMLVDFNAVTRRYFDTSIDYPYIIFPSYTRWNNEGQWGEWFNGEGEGETISFKHDPTEESYFKDSNLAAWKLWYSLDNDAERFAWADTENGKGVIYRMIDEFDNDVPYDFKNIQFKRYILEAAGAFATDVAKGGELEIVKEKLQEMSHKIHADFWYYGEYISDVYPDAIPDARYVPFGDIDYSSEGPQVLCEIDENNFGWFYTFHNEDEDASLQKPNVDEGLGVYDNTIKDSCYVFLVEEGTGSYYPTNINAQSLNNIVFVGNYCYSNSFGKNCGSNSLGNDCNYNSFGNNCYYNSLGNYCYSNSFGNNCNYNSFGNYCFSNSFGNNCYSNSLGNDCYFNSFGNNCNYNSFGNYCISNSLGNDCYFNSFKDQDGIADNALYNKLDDGVNNIELWYDDNNGNYGELKNHHVCRGCKETRIEIYEGRDFETTYAMTSDGQFREYCIADVV